MGWTILVSITVRGQRLGQNVQAGCAPPPQPPNQLVPETLSLSGGKASGA